MVSARNAFRVLFLFGVLLVLAACSGDDGPAGAAGPAGADGAVGAAGPAGPAGDAGDAASLDAAGLSCTGCHDDSSVITGKTFNWTHSVHGSGTATAYAGGRASCSGCHSGGGFSAAIAAGVNNAEAQETADPNPSRIDCRACHDIHTTYTDADWALETTDAVELMAFPGKTFDGGEGNLCVNCHQPRRGMSAPVDGMVEVTSTHWGPHHGPQSAMLLGLAGSGPDGLALEGNPASHATLVEDTCVTCHMGEGDNHSYEPDVANCQSCHSGIEDFDFSGLQTEVQEGLDQLEKALIAKGWLDEEGHPAVTSIPAGEAAALWNWIYIAHEDKSLGVHNPTYTKALIQSGLESLGVGG